MSPWSSVLTAAVFHGEPEDLVNRRILAHIRQVSAKREIGINEMARMLGLHQSRLSRLLGDFREVSGALLLRFCSEFLLDPWDVLKKNPDPKFFELGSEFKSKSGRPRKAHPNPSQVARGGHGGRRGSGGP